MTRYELSIDPSNQQYLHFNVTMTSEGDETVIYLPKWRPGRYELGNFAKNVKRFRVFNEKNEPLTAVKLDSSSWKVNTKDAVSLRVQYSYYAAELNAGSTFIDASQLYVNPVNCFIYKTSDLTSESEVQLSIPEEWEIASGYSFENRVARFPNFHELADNPFVCSGKLLHETYEVNGVLFHIWFNGLNEVPWEKVIRDFKAFTTSQMNKFIEFPVKEYHFINQMVPYKAYHGVEHQRSTVILLGPTPAIFTSAYDDLLGVSSHELYHTWNVKAIRPIDMFPYDYQRENFSKLGYLCEGITTYMGDLHLMKSGVFSLNEYLRELSTQLQKHFDNPGRYNMSVAESSWDTWLDGYVPGAPGRKVSIYTEGCLFAFLADVQIIQYSNGKYTLDELMKRLYFQYALEGKGVSETDLRTLLVELGGDKMNELLDDYVYGTRGFEGALADACEAIGLDLWHEPTTRYSAAKLGIKSLHGPSNRFVIKGLYQGAPADLGGLMLEDEILAVNDFVVGPELDTWLTYLDDHVKTVTVIRAGKLVHCILPEVQRPFYVDYMVKELKEDLNHSQKKWKEAWMN